MAKFEICEQVSDLMGEFRYPWMIAGGWSIDLHAGEVTRKHNDIEIAILRMHQSDLRRYLAGWDFYHADPQRKGVLEKWEDEVTLELPIHEIHAFNKTSVPPKIEILLNESRGTDWLYRRDESITCPLSSLRRVTPLGIPYITPEVALLYKSKNLGPIDRLDLMNVINKMEPEQVLWLTKSIETIDPHHSWLEILRG